MADFFPETNFMYDKEFVLLLTFVNRVGLETFIIFSLFIKCKSKARWVKKIFIIIFNPTQWLKFESKNKFIVSVICQIKIESDVKNGVFR